jgi:hypothetical protein
MSNLKSFQDKIKKHPALFLTYLNLFFVVLIVFYRDPLGLFVQKYENSERFFQIKKEEIRKIEISRTGDKESIKTLNFMNNKWIYSINNQNYSADHDKVNQLMDKLLDARRFTIVADDELKKQEYGFTPPDSFIIKVFNEKEEYGSLHLGNTGAGGSFSYVSYKNENKVYLIEENLKSFIGRGSDDFFIQKKLNPISINPTDIFSINAEFQNNPLKNYELTKINNDWMIQKPISGKLKSDELSTFLTKISNLNAEKIITVSKTNIEGSLPTKFTIFYKNSKTTLQESFTFTILGFDKKESQFHVKKDSDENIYLISDYQINSILEFEPKIEGN